MKNNSFVDKFKNIPVPLLPTMVGAATLSNVYLTLGYTWIRHITMMLSAIILIAYIIKIVTNFNVVKNEYSNTVPASLYAGFTMITMILGSYVFDFSPTIGKAMWFVGLILHAIHIVIFTYRNVIKGVNIDTFLPSWFVTYNGIMVSTVVGGVMNEPTIGKIVVYYGIAVLIIIMPFMLYRLATTDIKDQLNKIGSQHASGSYEFFDTAAMLKGITAVIKGITYFIVAVASISLFIAGIGVMNMMYIAVSERTQEIGIRMAVGASQKQILWQFLIEAVMLTLSGGMIGYLAGLGVAMGISAFLPFKASVSLSTFLLAFGTSTVVGLVFGILPAKTASNKNLIDILR